jgi:hypothetical protein
MSEPQRVLDRQEVQIHNNLCGMAKLADEALANAMDSLKSSTW